MNLFKKKEKTFTITPDDIKNNLQDGTIHLWPRPNDDVEFIVPLFDAHKHYKHLKRMMWKHQRR